MASDKVTEPETAETVQGRPGKSVDDQSIDELVAGSGGGPAVDR